MSMLPRIIAAHHRQIAAPVWPAAFADWSNRIKIAVLASQVNSNLTNFPVYVDLSTLPTSFFSTVRSDGGDIRITKADGVTQVPREVVDIDTGAETGELHFKADGTLSASIDTEFYIYYGNSGASDYATNGTYGAEKVWDSNFVLVSHAGGGTDSTSNGNNGTPLGGVSYGDTPGQMGRATTYDGGSARSNQGTDSSLNITGDVTFSAWAKAGTDSNVGVLISKYNSGQDRGFLLIKASTYEMSARGRDGTATYHVSGNSTTLLSTSTWRHFVGQRDGTVWKIFAQGVQENSNDVGTSGSLSNESTLWIGCLEVNLYPFKGYIDEVRVSNIARSPDWIAAEYTNQSAPGTFYSVGTPEVQ